MKDLILFGAYDRFNYGDMMMPLAIARWIERNRPDVLERYRVRYASLSVSDMSARDCVPTEAILDVCKTAPEGSALIVTGGEVVGPTRADLFLHNSKDEQEHRKMQRLRRRDPAAFDARLEAEIGPLWDYPYLPPKECLPEGGQIILNAIGGSLPVAEADTQETRRRRVAEAGYVSVRSQHLFDDLATNGITSAFLAPCAVGLIAEGYFSDLESGPRPCADPYFVVQSVYNPKNIDPGDLAAQIRSLSEASGLRPYLVPLATAAGHYDHKTLELVRADLGDLALMDEENSLSSILTTFRHAEFYTGTSLHGTITAMAYGIPYYPFKKSISKLGAYLDVWSTGEVQALQKVRTPKQIAKIPWASRDALRAPLQENAQRLSRLAGENLARIVDRLD